MAQARGPGFDSRRRHFYLSSPCRFKGPRTVAAPIVSSIDTIIIGLRTTEESCPSDSSTAVITLSNFSHHLTHTAITLISQQSLKLHCMFCNLHCMYDTTALSSNQCLPIHCLSGFALGHLPEERVPIISKEHICNGTQHILLTHCT